jgi:dienelactone hydrolase
MNYPRLLYTAAAIASALPLTCNAQVALDAPSVPPVDAPELAHIGQFAVGTQILQFVVPAAPTLTGPASWKIAPRALSARVWYPAASAPSGTPERYVHTINARGSQPVRLVTPGISHAGAPLHQGRFPLVLISHGFRGWSESMSYLGENLASKGYVVAAIDHADPSNNDPGALALSFGNVLLQRTGDQKAVLQALLTRSDGIAGMIDRKRVGLIGYSMGGYGALATAGAAYDPASAVFRQLPADARASLLAESSHAPIDDRIKALVTIAPWGGQPATRVWTAASLARITAPALIIDGEDDDVVDYRGGVRWIDNAMTGSDRWLLTYEAARHNVGNNAAPPGLPDFGAVESQAEPVWRGDRLNAINVHFITAFLDLTLKADASRRAYLDVPTPRAVDGRWPEPVGPAGSGAVAGDLQRTHWRGFQRRWAIGLRLTHTPRGPASARQVDKPETEQQKGDQR